MTTTTASSTLVDALVTQLAMSERAFHRNVEGLTHEESLIRPQPGGNSINWVVGHIVAGRNRLLTILGEQSLLSPEAIEGYRRGADGNLTNPLPLGDLIATFDRSQPMFVSRLQALSEEQLTAKAPFPSPAGADAPLGAALSTLVMHEGYHVGQLGVLRRLAGKGGAI